jgi:hypothetical protein
MSRLMTGIIITTTLYLALIIILALTTPNEVSLYLDDVSIIADGKTIHNLNFNTNNTNPGEYVGDVSIVEHSEDDYASPPSSLAILRKGAHETILLIIDDPLAGWSELTISFMTKMSGVPPSRLWLGVNVDDGYLGSSASIQLGERDFLSGVCHWEAHDAWDAPTPRSHFNLDDGGSIGWDWSSWHKVGLILSRSTSTFTFSVDSNVLCILEFGSYYGSNLRVEWGK